MRYLRLTLSSPFMYFARTGTTTLGDWSFTEQHPTRRAVVGMIGCAMGIPRGDDRLSALSDDLVFMYRTITPGQMMTDSQTVHGGEKGLMRFKGPNDTKNSILRYINYLMDARFEVYVGGTDDMLKAIHNAFLDPVFAPYIGKRTCIPNEPFVSLEFQPLSEEEIRKERELVCI